MLMPASAFPSFNPRSESKKRTTSRSPRPPVMHRCEELSTRLHDYTFRQRLGKGAFGQVFLAETNVMNSAMPGCASASAKERGKRRLVAVKVVRRTLLARESTRALACAEADNLRRISETGSLFFTQLRETFCDPHNLYIVTDYLVGGTLRSEMSRSSHRFRQSGGRIPNDRIVLIMAQLVEALAQLRALRIVHRDIKPENILLDARGNIVLSDFGLSRRFETASCESGMKGDAGLKRGRSAFMCNSRLSIFKLRRKEDKETRSTGCGASLGRENLMAGDTSSTDAEKSCMTDTGCGTLAYAAPEMHRGEAYSFPADIYSLGVVFYELLFNRLPPYPPTSRESIGAHDTASWFLDTEQNKREPVPIPIQPDALDLLKSLMLLDPTKRITIPELRIHPFFAGVHWPTIAARAYTLPEHHNPYLPFVKFMSRYLIKPGIFVDPLVTLEDGPVGALEDAYNVQRGKELSWRPGEKHRWTKKKGKSARALGDAKSMSMSVWDLLRRREDRVRRRDWAKDIKREMKDSSIGVAELKCGSPVKSAKQDNANAQNLSEVNADRGDRAITRSKTSMVASAGHGTSSYQYNAAQVDGPRTLRRITQRLPVMREPSSQIDKNESILDLCSTIAVVSRSFTRSTSEVVKSARSALARISTDLPPHSPESSASSSSPLSSTFSMGLFVTRALEQVYPSSSSPTPVRPFTSVTIKQRTGSVVEVSLRLRSSCPSLLPSSSCSTAVSSSFPPTPVRGNSHLPSVYYENDGVVSALRGIESRKSGLPFAEPDTSTQDTMKFLGEATLVRRRARTSSCVEVL